jgi:hypothetical protein
MLSAGALICIVSLNTIAGAPMLKLKPENIRYAASLLYLAGGALTYNHLIKVGRESLTQASELSGLVFKNILISVVWPLYWVFRAFVG